ncbi:hypothetical protein IKW72_07350 [bacterium]|nr:hypothetical protein [bacterium]
MKKVDQINADRDKFIVLESVCFLEHIDMFFNFFLFPLFRRNNDCFFLEKALAFFWKIKNKKIRLPALVTLACANRFPPIRAGTANVDRQKKRRSQKA